MVTNVGQRDIHNRGGLIGMNDRPWYNPESMANVFSFTNMAKQYKITYDNTVEDAFIVHTATGIVKFKRNAEGLYVYKLPDNYKAAVKKHNDKKRKERQHERQQSHMTTVAKNQKKIYSRVW